MFDMFASESPVAVEEVAPVVVNPAPETCDDPDGYYKTNIGELIRNYKVRHRVFNSGIDCCHAWKRRVRKCCKGD